MAKKKEESFLSTPPCPFRRVSFGTAHCTISTDNHVSEVDPLTCHNCDVPTIIGQPRCQFLSLGTELKPFRGEGKLVTAMACRALNIKLYHLKTCAECPLYSEVDSLVEVVRQQQELADLQIPIRESLVEQIARDIRLDYGAVEEDMPPMRPIRCWRFPEGYCKKLPVYTRGKVNVYLTRNDRNDELYKSAILPAIKSLELQPYRIDEEMTSDEPLCRLCENIQEGDFLVINLDDWNIHALFITGVAYGLGVRLAMIKNLSPQDVPLWNQVSHDVICYEQIGDLRRRLVEVLTVYVKPHGTG